MSPTQVPSALVTDRSLLALPVVFLFILRGEIGYPCCFVGQIELDQIGSGGDIALGTPRRSLLGVLFHMVGPPILLCDLS